MYAWLSTLGAIDIGLFLGAFGSGFITGAIYDHKDKSFLDGFAYGFTGAIVAYMVAALMLAVVALAIVAAAV